MSSAKPLTPRDPNGPLRVLVIGRVSTPHQDVNNIEAGYEYAERYLKTIYDGPTHIKHLGEQGSGMIVDRKTILEAIDEIATKTWDAVLMEDTSKCFRNPRWQYAFVQDTVDAGTRVLAPGDVLDTTDDNWEVTMGTAALRHGLHIPDTRRRVRRTAHAAFHRGGMVLRYRYGYRRLTKEEAAAGQFGPKGLRIVRIDACTPWIREMMERFLRGEKVTSIVQWLTDEDVPPNKYVKSGKWSTTVVKDLLKDRILCGTRKFRDRIYEPVFRTGKHRRTKNPTPELEHYPELVHITVEEHEAILREFERRARAPRAAEQGPPVRLNISRSRTIWPGQSLNCAVCGKRMYYAGEQLLKCANTLHGANDCWNHVQVPARLMRQRVMAWLVDRMQSDHQLREVFVEAAWQELERRRGRRRRAQNSSDDKIDALQKQAANIAKAIALGGDLPALVEQSKAIDAELKAEQRRRAKAQTPDQACAAVLTRDDVAGQIEQVLQHLVASSYEFADLLRRAFPEIRIYPVQALDTPQVRPRAKLVFRPSAFLAAAERGAPAPSPDQDVQLLIDLFEPPVHIKYLPKCLAAKQANPKLSLRKMAAQLGANYMTIKRALAYARLMEKAGVTDPYRELEAEPTEASRWKPRAAS
jgi:site-specific DNA recombinase